MVTMILAVLGCVTADQSASDPLSNWPTDPAVLSEFCTTLPYPELETTCHVQAAADFARSGDADRAETECSKISKEVWTDECHFRVGEELGRAGATLTALRHCARAGWFGRNCLTHAAWNLPNDPSLHPDTPAATIAAAFDELSAAVTSSLHGAGDGLPGEGLDLVMARFGYNLFVGSGNANPESTHLPGPVGVVVRTGFAIEAVRLLEDPTVDRVLAVWSGSLPVPVGDSLGRSAPVGRYAQRVPSPMERGVPFAPTFGGGSRIVGETAEEDITIAALEALFWREQTPSEVFIQWLDDPRERVRWTAARLMRLAGPAGIDLEAELARIAQHHPDENVRWHAAFGLREKTWQKKPRPRR